MSERDPEFMTLADPKKGDIFSKAQFGLLIKRIRELKLTSDRYNLQLMMNGTNKSLRSSLELSSSTINNSGPVQQKVGKSPAYGGLIPSGIPSGIPAIGLTLSRPTSHTPKSTSYDPKRFFANTIDE